MKRYINQYICNGLSDKLVILSGPRQVGKTTLSKSLFETFDYINFDDSDDRLILHNKSWDRDKALIIFDEIHKMPEWKRYLKGVYDKEGNNPKLMVTGSARLDTFKKMGDSLAGRYYRFRLHPFDLKELLTNDPTIDAVKTINDLMTFSGFPEPFLKQSEDTYNIWRKTHQDIILRQDLLDLENISSIQSIETLVALLKKRVGSPVSYTSLARDLQVSPNTVKSWLLILENLFMIFKVTPYHRNVARAILKEPKYYFFDTASVKGDKGVRFENLVACALLKELQFLEDTKGIDYGLHYVKTSNGNEVDFLITINDEVTHLIEVKYTDSKLSKNLNYFHQKFPNALAIQLVKEINRNYTYPNGCKVIQAAEWLGKVTLINK